jgi:hypothetical protein
MSSTEALPARGLVVVQDRSEHFVAWRGNRVTWWSLVWPGWGCQADRVQIVEANDAWVRVAELDLRRRDTPLRFVLYPMLHVGSRDFYQEVARRLAQVEVVVTEGVGPSRAASMLTSTYRAMADDLRLRLVVQNIDYGSLPGQVICPDIPGEEFQVRWQKVPRWQRAATLGITGSVNALQRIFGSRWLQLMLEDSSLEDLPSNEEVLQPQLLPDLERMLVDERDQRLVQALDDLHERRAGEPITVAVVYGAQHIRAVVTGLGRHGYRVHSGDWLTVLEFD